MGIDISSISPDLRYLCLATGNFVFSLLCYVWIPVLISVEEWEGVAMPNIYFLYSYWFITLSSVLLSLSLFLLSAWLMPLSGQLKFKTKSYGGQSH